MTETVEPPRHPTTPDEHGLSHWEGEPLNVWEALWRVPRFEAFSTLGSTNDRVRWLAVRAARSFTVVTADEQTRGRGRSGATWASAPSKGLWMSILLHVPSAEARLAVPILVGLAACRAVEGEAAELTPMIKWPNDVLLGERKVCGVLCEAFSTDDVVAGVGLNLFQGPRDFPPDIRGSAVSLSMATGRELSRSRLAGELIRNLRDLLSAPGSLLGGSVGREVERRDALRGRRIRVSPGPMGVAAGIDPLGGLRLEVSSGEVVRVVAGSVTIAEG